MSGLAGVFWHDGRPAAAADAGRLLVQLAQRRGKPKCIARGSIALGSLEDFDEAPGDHAALDRSVLIALDGRLDNREDLARELSVHRNAPDRALIAAAWRRWGRECPVHLIGEFAFALFDGERLFLVRDCAPFRPLFYRVTPRACCWASEIAALVREDRPPVNEGMVAEHLADRLVTLNETLFQGVFRLPPAHALEVRADGGLQVWRYWRPDPRAEINYRDQREYDEHFRALFREAVRCRLHPQGRVALWYSGGVDSTAVAAQMAALRDEGEPRMARDLQTVSISAPGYAVDETPFFSRGATHFRLPNTVRPFYFGSAADFEQDARHSCDIPVVPSMMGGRRGWEVLAERDVNVGLTGLGGDDWFIGSQFSMVDDIRALRWRSAAARLRAERREPFGFSAGQLLRLGVWAQLPHGSRRLVRRAFGWTATPAHVSPSLASRVSLDDRLRQARWSPPFKTLAQRDLYQSATGASAVMPLEVYARMAARWRVESRHPFIDRRLIEFALAVPSDQLLRPGVPRHIVLSAVVNHTPRAIYNRIDGADYILVMRDLWLRLGGRALVEASLAELPAWFERSRLRDLADQVETFHPASGNSIGRQTWALWQAFAIHMWWKSAHQPTTRTRLEMREVSHDRRVVPQA